MAPFVPRRSGKTDETVVGLLVTMFATRALGAPGRTTRSKKLLVTKLVAGGVPQQELAELRGEVLRATSLARRKM